MKKEDLIQKYFLDKLSPEELEKFNDLLNKDEEFREQYEFEKDVREVIKNKERQVLKNKLEDIEKEIDKPKKREIPWGKLSIAASIAIILGLGWYLTVNSGPDMEQLYVSNYKVYPNTVYSIERGNGEESLERKAFIAYETGNYKEAIRLFDTLRNKEAASDYIDFYLAQSLLFEEDKRAIPLFEKVIKKEGDFYEESMWYLSLAYIKKEKFDKAREGLKILIEKNRYKHKEAKIILKELP